MIDNIFVQCNYCKAKLRLRFQMGYFDIPFDIRCPVCGVHVHGLRRIKDNCAITVNNANVIKCGMDEADYYADFSVELPHAKIAKYESLEKLLENGFGPFMMTSRLYELEVYTRLVEDVRHFLYFRDTYWPKLIPLFDLFFNGKIELTADHFLKLSPRFIVKNEFDALMALHQTTILGMNSILSNGTLDKFMGVSRRIFETVSCDKIDNLCLALGGNEQLNSLSKRLVKIYDRWMINFEKYIPATMLALGDAIGKFNKGKYGIATTSFEDMKSFYSDSYELILDFLGIAIGLNNIVVRGDCNAFPVNTIRVNKTTNSVGNFVDYLGIVKASRLSLLVEDEPFSKVIPLNRNMRNAIAHFDYDFDAGTQKILFRDKHRNKDNSVELYLIDLALLCYENMTILVYLDELLYNLRKVCYMKAGMPLHIKASKQS